MKCNFKTWSFIHKKEIKIQSRFLLIITFLIILLSSHAQVRSNMPFGGEYKLPSSTTQCLSDENRTKILLANKEVVSSLKLIRNKNRTADNQLFIFPLRSKPELDNYGFYAIYNFVDHDPAYPDHLLDYFGGSRSYDRANGYNHQGTDIVPWPFAWYLMDSDLVEIVSMASGTIIGKVDGNYDRNCGFNERDWNAVYIIHDNQIIAWYGHLKNGSVTSKAVGDTVEAGEYLGVVGSSGSSSAPHLHLELYDADYNLIDPWEGPYNATINTSLWENQPEYYDSKINKIASHSNWPIFPDCPEQEILNLQNKFEPGDTVFLITYYQDQLRGQVSDYKVTTPNNSVWAEWSHSMEDEYYSASYWGWWLILPDDAPPGDWEFRVNYESVYYTHTFTVESTTGLIDEEFNVDFKLVQNYPNPFNPSTIIAYYVPYQAIVDISIYNSLGELVTSLVNGEKFKGKYEVEWNGKDANMNDVSSGIYFAKLTTSGNFSTIKMLLIK